MASIPNRDTQPELLLRRELHRLGFRYRLHPKDVFGMPDIVNRAKRVALFVDGDFWPGNAHNLCGIETLADLFPTNTEWWVAKIQRNVERDKSVTARLETTGWKVVRRWESDVKRDPAGTAHALLKSLGLA